MPKRMLQIVGSLLAIGALAVTATAANADGPATARMAGGGSNGGSGCQDNTPPQSQWGNGWSGHDGNGSYWRGWGDGNGDFSGQAYDSACTAADRSGKVARVMVGVQRVRGSRCQNMSAAGKLGRIGNCSHTQWFPATGTTSWNHHIANRLPAGRYRLHHQAIDGAGNRGRRHSRSLSIR